MIQIPFEPVQSLVRKSEYRWMFPFEARHLSLRCVPPKPSFLYCLGTEYSSYSVSKQYNVFASENAFRAQVLKRLAQNN